MTFLYSKHFGDKVFLCDLNKKIMSEILDNIKDNVIKIPNSGILGRFDNGMVGLFVWYVGKYGCIKLEKESTTHKTINSWAKFHMSDTI